MRPKHDNRLIHETSPYLLQHAHNPVNWYPWGEEALRRAREDDKPILLSIGYAACHWCHVMERESFEDEAIAAVMNEHFVCIKVDREERPDIDDIYMAATIAMSGSGGWPMTVILTPNQQPFFAGTYFPPEDKYGRPGFKGLLLKLADLWKNERASLLDQAAELTSHVRAQSTAARPAPVSHDAIEEAVATLASHFDPHRGGFGSAPKFPPCAALELLLRYHHDSGSVDALTMVRGTLDGMKNGGIYDHVGGGFARYSTDAEWLVPHFEKMLYDNAQLSKVYLAAHQVTHDPEYRRVARETLDYIIREMQSPEGGYYSATDADSEGVEGRFFVWKVGEVASVTSPEEAEALCAYYDVTPAGNWEGVNILRTAKPRADVAAKLAISEDDLAKRLESGRKKLYEARAQRVPPLLDDKVLTAWNGLMIGAMAEGFRVLQDRRYLVSACRAVDAIMTLLRKDDGRLLRTARQGKAHLDAYLEDYAYLSDALVNLYEAGGDPRHLRIAESLTEQMVEDFADPDGGAFFHTARHHEQLLVRTREGHDGALPNPNAIACQALVRLASHLDRSDLRDVAEGALRAYGRQIERTPRAFVASLSVVDMLLTAPLELVVAGDPTDERTVALNLALARRYLPGRVIAHVGADGPAADAPPLARGKGPVDGAPALYVCRNFVCQRPVTDPSEVARVLDDQLAANGSDRAGALAPPTLPGRATPEATARAVASASAHLGGQRRTLGKTGLVVSPVGFGGYRVDDATTAHREALRRALDAGVNVVDTSTNYADGASERLVGEVLAERARAGTLRRDGVVVVSKIGYAQGSNQELARRREGRGVPFPEMVKISDDLWHCLHPQWLEEQLTRSLTRLGLETLDVCLLHNPEYFLKATAKDGTSLETARSAFYERVTAAFAHLEDERRRGRIGAYGVSSNTLASPDDDPEATRLADLLAAAEKAGGARHGFSVVQLPLNLLESSALVPTDGTPATIAEAQRRNLGVLTNRPLNAILEGGLFRLVEPPKIETEGSLDDQFALVAKLESEFAERIAVHLRSNAGAPSIRRLFSWGENLKTVVDRVESLTQWQEIERGVIAPQMSRAMANLDRVLRGDLGAMWEDWKTRYVPALDALIDHLRRHAAERSEARITRIWTQLARRLPAPWVQESLARIALGAPIHAPGVATVLVGMRDPEYVDDALALLKLPPISDPAALFGATTDHAG